MHQRPVRLQRLFRLFRRGLTVLRRDERGVLSFEWILLITVLTIGIVGGITAVRDAVISELGDTAGAMVAVDQSYSVAAPPCSGGRFGSFRFADTQCNRAGSCRPESPPAYAVQGGGAGQ